MKTHGLIGCSTVVAALLTGCSAMPQPDDGVVGETESAIRLRCPDPTTECTQSNGAGVYTDEDGYAGMGQQLLMITHFTNSGTSVGFAGHFWTGTPGKFTDVSDLGGVYGASYNGISNWGVKSVSETNTVPTWTLVNPNDGTEVAVTGGQLLGLQLSLYLNQSTLGPKAFTIAFNGGGIDHLGSLAIEHFNMITRAAGAASFYQYCVDSGGAADQVVFQQSIDVDVDNGKVTRDSTTTKDVTLSCRKGAIATVHSWGYAYKPGFKTYYFDAGINLKRAAYCGDWRHWTISGTKIRIADSSGINTEAIDKTEAYWGLGGALCVNPGYRRVMSKFFDPATSCGQPMPDCSAYPPSSGYWIEDGATLLQTP
jgi:hypothetical protein